MSFHYPSGFDIDFVVNFLIMTETDPADRNGSEIKDSQNNQKLAGATSPATAKNNAIIVLLGTWQAHFFPEKVGIVETIKKAIRAACSPAI